MTEQDGSRALPMTMDAARAFVEAASWVFAETYAAFAPHEYTTRWTCRERGIEADFEAFALLIESDGYWRRWGRNRWRSLSVGPWTFWLHWNLVESVRERTVINRWWTDRMAPQVDQLTLIGD
ncbi:MAG: hypothetical protein ACEQSX_08540 [Baekduiaceae bacterium]